MARQQKDFTYDANLLLKDAGLVAASAAATVSSVAKVLDLGLSRLDGRVICDFSAVEADTNDERYDIITQFSNSSTFASGVFNGPVLLMGDATTTLESVDTAIGRRELPFCNEINGVLYRYMRIWTRVVGTVATGINYTAFVVQSPGGM